MKKKILLLFFLPFISLSQDTYIPGDAFELALINLGFDFILNDSIPTANIDTISYLDITGQGIVDLTGLKDFVNLKSFFCSSNQIVTIDLSNQPLLFEVSCGSNQLTSLNMKNGNNQGLWYFQSTNNPSLLCIDVDDVAWADYNWSTDSWTSFSTNCSSTSINQTENSNRRLVKITDVLGRETSLKKNVILLLIYNDGTIEKKVFY